MVGTIEVTGGEAITPGLPPDLLADGLVCLARLAKTVHLLRLPFSSMASIMSPLGLSFPPYQGSEPSLCSFPGCLQCLGPTPEVLIPWSGAVWALYFFKGSPRASTVPLV